MNLDEFGMVELDLVNRDNLYRLIESLSTGKCHCHLNIDIHNGPFPEQITNDYKVFITDADWPKLMKVLKFLQYPTVDVWFEKPMNSGDFVGTISTTPPHGVI